METLSDTELDSLIQAVEYNCAISDARYARDYSLCVYLLRMRECYRWRHKLPLTLELRTDQVGDWVSETESYWDEVEEKDYQNLQIGSQDYDPFNHQEINRRLVRHGYVYSAGLGRFGQPHFTLSTLIEQSTDPLNINPALEIYHCGDILASDILFTPAMAQGNTIFVQQQGIERYLWDLYDDWCLHRKPGPMSRLVEHYGLQRDKSLDKVLKAAADEIAPTVLAHEHGEIAAGKILGPSYSELTLDVAGTRPEAYLRAVRDLLADTLVTWPAIVNDQAVHLLDFWLAGLNGIRLSLMEQCASYNELVDGTARDRLQLLDKLIDPERNRWQQLCNELHSTYLQKPAENRAGFDVSDHCVEWLRRWEPERSPVVS